MENEANEDTDPQRTRVKIKKIIAMMLASTTVAVFTLSIYSSAITVALNVKQTSFATDGQESTTPPTTSKIKAVNRIWRTSRRTEIPHVATGSRPEYEYEQNHEQKGWIIN